MEEAAVAEEDNSTMTPSIILDSLIHCGVAGLEPRTSPQAKGMLPLKPEENRWRRAGFTIGTPTVRPVTQRGPNLYRTTVAASAVYHATLPP